MPNKASTAALCGGFAFVFGAFCAATENGAISNPTTTPHTLALLNLTMAPIRRTCRPGAFRTPQREPTCCAARRGKSSDSMRRLAPAFSQRPKLGLLFANPVLRGNALADILRLRFREETWNIPAFKE